MKKEVYVHNNPRQYWQGEPHTDNITYIAPTIGEARASLQEQYGEDYKDMEIIYNEVLSPEDYNRTINANCGETEEDTIRVIIFG